MSYPPGMRHGRGELEVDVTCACGYTTRLLLFEEAWGSEWKDDAVCGQCGEDISGVADIEEPDYESELADRMED